VAFSSEAAESMNQLADELLCGPHILSLADRELIATYVSAASDCVYCQTIHGAIAAQHLGGGEQIVAEVKDNFRTARISGKLKALLIIADRAQRGGKTIRARDVNRARKQGASDLDIHDTVLIAAMFCMCTGKRTGSRRARGIDQNGNANRKP
jgi:uncharacterized peroxidase-related enzyme